MVSGEVGESAPVDDDTGVERVNLTPWWVLLVALGVAIVGLVVVLVVVVNSRVDTGAGTDAGASEITENSGNGSGDGASGGAGGGSATVPDTSWGGGDVGDVAAVDFQPVIDSWVKSVGGDVGVAIYDLDRGEMVGGYQADAKFATASLYKLFVVYEGYRKLLDGEWDSEQVADGATVADCLDLAIRQSNSECAEAIWEMIGQDELDDLMREEYGFSDLTVSDLAASPSEVAEIMRKFYDLAGEMPGEMRQRMLDSFLNQPAMEYDWRQGLPSGFTDRALVYNKVGWAWNEDEEQWDIYNDAAIVEFVDSGRHFAVAVMTSGVDYYAVRRLGEMMEEYYYQVE